jgi:hypothetical protein
MVEFHKSQSPPVSAIGATAAKGERVATTNNRRLAGERVNFESGFETSIMAIDGTWRRECTMHDASRDGAKLTVEGSLEQLDLRAFFLLLTNTGRAYRRCEIAWVNGNQIGAKFVVKNSKVVAKTLARRSAPLPHPPKVTTEV